MWINKQLNLLFNYTIRSVKSLFSEENFREKSLKNITKLEDLKSAEDWYNLSRQPELLKKYELTVTSIDEHPKTFTRDIFTREIEVITFSNGVSIGYEYIEPFDSPARSEVWFVQAPK